MKEEGYIDRLEDMNWEELLTLSEKLGQCLIKHGLSEACVNMSRVCVIPLSEGELFNNITMKIVKTLPVSKDNQIHGFKRDAETILQNCEGVEVKLVPRVAEGCEYEVISGVLPVLEGDDEDSIRYNNQPRNEQRERAGADLGTSSYYWKEYEEDAGGQISIAHEPGQVHVVLFWSPWVTKSQQMLSAAQKLMYKNRSKWNDKVKISAISIKTSHEIVPQLIEGKRWYLIDHYYREDSKCFERYGISSVPLIVLVNKDGIVAFKGAGFKDSNELESSINILLQGGRLHAQLEAMQQLKIEHEKRSHRTSST